MKNAYSDEVANFLGYQKQYPTAIDWVKATIICLLFGIIVVGGAVYLLKDLLIPCDNIEQND